PRPVRDEYGEPLPALMVGSGRYLAEFTRTGWSNPLGRPRSELQRVAYDVVDGELIRYFWFVLDRAEDSRPIPQTIFEEVEDFRLYLVSEEGDRTDVWPALDAERPLPAAVEMVISFKDRGELRRLVPLPAVPVIETQAPGTGGGTGGSEEAGG
ncbi:MAG: type II secretion system minor pseudopilin GspJ, partial [Pseudomonadales bacterium]|nr:type II secretion system minor pseudopilin GspJ [Pseudomonadales bacterium]